MKGKKAITFRYNVGVPEKADRVENHTPVIPKKIIADEKNLVNSRCWPGLI